MALHVFQNIKVKFSVIINMLLSNENPMITMIIIRVLWVTTCTNLNYEALIQANKLNNVYSYMLNNSLNTKIL